MSNAYSAKNKLWREKLAALVKRLTDEDLAKPAGGPGWTVNGLLGHLAFWDLRAVRLIEHWKSGAVGPAGIDIDIVNESMRPFLNAVAHHEIRRLSVDAAESIDAVIDGLDAGFLARIEDVGKPVHLDRSSHRTHHMSQIERVLQDRAP